MSAKTQAGGLKGCPDCGRHDRLIFSMANVTVQYVRCARCEIAWKKGAFDL